MPTIWKVHAPTGSTGSRRSRRRTGRSDPCTRWSSRPGVHSPLHPNDAPHSHLRGRYDLLTGSVSTSTSACAADGRSSTPSVVEPSGLTRILMGIPAAAGAPATLGCDRPLLLAHQSKWVCPRVWLTPLLTDHAATSPRVKASSNSTGVSRPSPRSAHQRL